MLQSVNSYKKPCKYGHFSARYNDYSCKECRRDRARTKKSEWRKRKRYECIFWARKRAKKKGISFSLNREWFDRTWTGKCQLTGIEFVKIGNLVNPYSATIDRIDSSKGYTQENCRFILYALNGLKSNGTEEDMYKIAQALLSKRVVL